MNEQDEHIRTRRRMGRGPLLAALVLAPSLGLALLPQAEARTWRVEKDGSGDYTVIQDAVDAAAEGDTILIGPGEYTESSVWEYDVGYFGETYVGVPIDNITLIGAGRDLTIIGPAEKNWDEQNFLPKGISLRSRVSDGLVIENLTVRNCREGLRLSGEAVARNLLLYENGSGIYAFNDTFTIEDSEIRGSDFIGVIYVRSDKTSYVRRVQFINCVLGALSLNGPKLIIEDSEFRNAAVYAEAQFNARMEMYRCVGTGSGNGGITSQFGSDFLVEDCRLTVRNQTVVIMEGSRATIRGSHLRSRVEQVITTLQRGQPIVNGCDLISEASPERRFAVFLGVTVDDHPDLAELIMDGNDDPRIDEFVDFSDWLTGPVSTQSSSFGGLKGTYRQ
jgi:hypothetical protein